MPSRDVVAWTTLISGYARSEDECEWALELFRRMGGVVRWSLMSLLWIVLYGLVED